MLKVVLEANNIIVPTLENKDIHLWWMNCADFSPSEDEWQLLDAEEKERALRFKRPCDRDRYVLVRSILRRLIATYLEIPPHQVEFCYGDKGKPILRSSSQDESLEFNVSHSHQMALWGFSRRQALGVDVEYIKPNHQGLSIAKRFFTALEYQALQEKSEGAQREFFFQLWTRKESCIKARGESLFEKIGQLEVPAQDCCMADWRSLSQENMYVRDLKLHPHYKASIASFNNSAALSCFEWKIGSLS